VDRLKTVILCGGRGTRLREYTEAIPKVLVEVGGRPILWHIMKGYAECQFTEFVLALGYLGQSVKQYFLELDGWKSHDLQLRLGSRAQPEVLGGGDQWDVILADTGIDTNTGGRLKRIERHLDDDTFFATYGDGLADIDHRQLLAFHRSHGLTATITVTRPRLGFGVVELNGESRVTRFDEKPPLDAWINGGFFVFNRRVFDYLSDDSVLEREPIERLAADGQLAAYRHSGFWACMDTYKDNVELNSLWSCGRAPWVIWGS
jgi:glucose-1-phosphate cytidylyltransferase